MKLIIVTHGQSNLDLGIEDNKQGLTEVGIIEARQLALKLKNEKVDFCYCSPALRCDQTLSAILAEKEESDIPVSVSRLLGPKTTKEDLAKLKSRINLFLDELRYDHDKDDTILAVTHKKPAEMAVLIATKNFVELDQGEITRLELEETPLAL